MFFTFLVFLALAIGVNSLGRRLLPWAMPPKKFRGWGAGLVGGVAGSLLDRFTLDLGLHLLGVNIAAAFLGASLFTLVLGLMPFLKILLGRNMREGPNAARTKNV